MAEFLGELGGVLMIALIVILFFRFLMDIGVDKSGVCRKRITGFALPALILALLQLMFGALYCNFGGGSGTVFDVNAIWTMSPVSDTHELVTSYSFLYVSQKGAMPLYYILSGVFAGVLYEMYDQCALYISMLSGIVTYAALGLIIARDNSGDDGDKRTRQLYTLLICLPGSVFLFLPSSFAAGMALFSVFLLVWNGGRGGKVRKVASLAIALLCLATHLVGICAAAVYIAGCLPGSDDKWSGIRDIAVTALAQLMYIIICGVNGWGSVPEYIIVYGVVFILGINRLKLNINHAVMTFVCLLMALISGFWLVGMMAGVM